MHFKSREKCPASVGEARMGSGRFNTATEQSGASFSLTEKY